MNRSTPASSALCYLLEFAHLMSLVSVMLSDHLAPCHPLLLFLQSFPALLFSVAKSCSTFCDPMDSNPPGFSTHGNLQERKLKGVAIPFSRGSAQPRDRTWVSHTAGRLFTIWATRETLVQHRPLQLFCFAFCCLTAFTEIEKTANPKCQFNESS